METHTCKVFIDDKPFNLKVKGDFSWCKEKICLYNKSNNIIENMKWEQSGFEVVKNILSINQFRNLKDSTKETLIKIIEDLGIPIDKKNFNLENYHLFIKSEREHQAIINKTRYLTIRDFDFDIDIITNYLSHLMNVKLTSWIKELGRSHIQVRINRPKSLDINPPHRDGYIDVYKDVLNVWLPLAGCNKNTSLPLVPSSHLISENQIFRTSNNGAFINKNVYSVPCILKTSSGNLRMVRPNPQDREALIFTPFLIHGAAFNNSSETRVAFELRFPRL